MCLQLKSFRLKPEKIEQPEKEFVPSFINPDKDDSYKYYSRNGLILVNTYIPEEIIIYILSFVDPRHLLRFSSVCSQWNKIIKSRCLWSIIYERKYQRKAKDLPWYLYYCLLTTNYFTNMLDEDPTYNTQEHWKFIIDSIEDLPITTETVPQDILDYHKNIADTCLLVIKTHLKPHMRRTFCFRPEKCYTEQWIFKLGTNKLMRHILDTYKPHLYFKGCGAVYGVQCGFIALEDFNGVIHNEFLSRRIVRKNLLPQHVYSIEVTVTDYPNEMIEGVIIETKYLEVAAGGTLDGAVIKLVFNSIKPIKDISKTADICYTYID